MKTIVINSMEDAEKYYDATTNTYVFSENGELCDVKIEMRNFSCTGNINAWNITAYDIDAWNITAYDIYAWDIKARDIDAGNINAWNITAYDIDARNITAYDIYAWNIKAWDITANDIDAWNINAENIDAWGITARDIDAGNINAHYISYYAVCVAYQNITCHEIHGRRENSVHMALDGTVRTGITKEMPSND